MLVRSTVSGALFFASVERGRLLIDRGVTGLRREVDLADAAETLRVMEVGALDQGDLLAHGFRVDGDRIVAAC